MSDELENLIENVSVWWRISKKDVRHITAVLLSRAVALLDVHGVKGETVRARLMANNAAWASQVIEEQIAAIAPKVGIDRTTPNRRRRKRGPTPSPNNEPA